MIVWIEHETGTLTSLDGLRTLGVVPTEEEETGNVVYDIRAAFGDRTDKTVTATILGKQINCTLVAEPQLLTLARYQSETAAKTYKRFIAMTMSRSGLRHETGCVIPYVTEEDLLELAQKFKGFDAELDAKAAAERNHPDAPPDSNWAANI